MEITTIIASVVAAIISLATAALGWIELKKKTNVSYTERLERRVEQVEKEEEACRGREIQCRRQISELELQATDDKIKIRRLQSDVEDLKVAVQEKPNIKIVDN